MSFLNKAFKGVKDKITSAQTDRKFKKAGEGHRLTDDSGPSRDTKPKPKPQVQPTAAMSEAAQADRDKRLQAALDRRAPPKPSESASKKAIQQEAARRLAEDRARTEEASFSEPPERERSEPKECEHSNAIERVFFTCERFCPNVILPKDQLIERVEESLYALLTEDFENAITAAVTLLFSRNRARGDELETAVQTLKKVITAIIDNPDIDKYRKINMNSSTFKDKIDNIRFAREFLAVAGFVEKRLDSTDTVHLVFEGNEQEAFDKLSVALAILSAHTEKDDVILKLHRSPLVFKIENTKIKSPELDEEFFKLSTDEVRKLQAARSEEVEKLTTLRTEEMREREAASRSTIYKYTAIRVRFPDYHLLQGTFSALEPLRNVREFIHERLSLDYGSFVLKDPARGTILNDEEKSLRELGLCPAVILHFDWDKESWDEFTRNNIKPQYLNEELQKKAEVYQT